MILSLNLIDLDINFTTTWVWRFIKLFSRLRKLGLCDL